MPTEKPGAELFKGVMLAHLILALHVVVILLVGLVVIFFGGIARYWLWILAAGLLLAGLGGYFLYRRLKARGSGLLRDIRGAAVPDGATLEVSFLGGLAAVKFGRGASSAVPQLPPPAGPVMLEDPETVRIRELTYLAQMYEKNLITREEFERAKGTILNPAQRTGSAGGTLGH